MQEDDTLLNGAILRAKGKILDKTGQDRGVLTDPLSVLTAGTIHWQKASCITVEPESPPHRKEEVISSGRGTFGLQQLLARYLDPMITGKIPLNQITKMRLIRAAPGGHEAAVRVLIAEGTDFMANEYGMKALNSAVTNRHDAIVRLLLKEADGGYCSQEMRIHRQSYTGQLKGGMRLSCGCCWIMGPTSQGERGWRDAAALGDV